MSLNSEVEFLQRCYGITSTEAENILKIRNLNDAMTNLEQRGFKANEEVLREYKNTPKSDTIGKKDEVYVGSGQVLNKPRREDKLVFYTDGIMINDNFTEYPKEELDYLRKMVKNGEFDANLLNEEDNEYRDFHIEYKDKPFKQSEDKISVSNSFSKLPGAGKRRIPRYLSLDRSETSVALDVFFLGEKRIIHISRENIVSELLELAKKYHTYDMQFISDGKKINKNEKLLNYRGKENSLE